MKTALGLFPSLAAALIAASANGQGQPPSDPFTVPGLRLSDDAPTPQDFTRIFGARMSTAFDADIVSLSTSAITFHFQPSRFDWKTAEPVTESDLAVVPGTDLDFVFTAGPAGLSQWSFDEPNATYGSVVIDPAWSDVTRLGVNPSGILHGLDPVAGVIRRFNPDPSAALTDSGDVLDPIVVGTDALDFALLDWNDDGTEDCAVLRKSNLSVIDGAERIEIWSAPTTGDGDAIEAVLGSEDDRDILVWVGNIGSSWVLRSSHSGTREDGFLFLGPDFTGDLHAADLASGQGVFKDTCQELMISIDTTRSWVLTRSLPAENGSDPKYLLTPDLTNLYSTYYQFDSAIQAMFLGGGGGGGSTGVVSGSGDIDQDGHLDPIFARDDDGMVAFQLDGYSPDDHIISSFNVELLPGTSGLIEVRVLDPGNAPAAATHLMAEVWRHSLDQGELSYTMDPDLVAREFVSLEEIAPDTYGTGYLDATAGHDPDHAYHVALRTVRVTDPSGLPVLGAPGPNDSVDRAWHTFTKYITESPTSEVIYQNWPSVVAATTLPPNPTPSTTDPIKTGGGTQAGQGTRTGTGPPPFGGQSHNGTTGSAAL